MAAVVVNILLTLATYNLLITDLYLVNTYTDTGIVRYTQNCNVELTMTDGDDTLYSYILCYIAAAENSIILLHTVSGQSGGTRGDGGNSFTPYRFFLVFDSIQLHSFYVLGNVAVVSVSATNQMALESMPYLPSCSPNTSR